MCSTKGLQRTLRKRLPHIDRWNRVNVYKYGDERSPVEIEDGHFIIYWHSPKRKNIHPYEYKQVPLSHLDQVYDRNRIRLRNQTKAYR